MDIKSIKTMANIQHYIFIDESGDPGKPFKTDAIGNKIPTGASIFYILTAIYLDSTKLFALENEIMEIRQKYGFRSEIKSTIIPLEMYKDLLIPKERALDLGHALLVQVLDLLMTRV